MMISFLVYGRLCALCVAVLRLAARALAEYLVRARHSRRPGSARSVQWQWMRARSMTSEIGQTVFVVLAILGRVGVRLLLP